MHRYLITNASLVYLQIANTDALKLFAMFLYKGFKALRNLLNMT